MRETTQIDELVGRRDEQGYLQRIAGRIVGSSAWAISAPSTIAGLGASTDPLLLEGECGVGKELVARLVHEAGPRSHRPFVTLSTEALDDRVLVAILFAAPDAMSTSTRAVRDELLERVRGGTLYIADVAALAPEIAQRVVRAVEFPESEIPRGAAPLGRTCRVIFGATRGLVAAVSRDRTSTIVRIPALRERIDDVAALAEVFVESACQRFGREPRVLSDAVIAAFSAYAWPGNVGELKRTLETMIRRSGPPAIGVAQLPACFGLEPVEAASAGLHEGINLHDEVQRFERSLLRAALTRTGGVQTKAAHILGLKVSTLNSKLSTYNIDASSFKPRSAH